MGDYLKKPKSYRRQHCEEFERICREEREAGETVVVAGHCDRDRQHLPCLSDIMVLSGLEQPCKQCLPSIQAMRDVDGWERHPATHGTFYTCKHLTPDQQRLIADRIHMSDVRNWLNTDADTGELMGPPDGDPELME